MIEPEVWASMNSIWALITFSDIISWTFELAFNTKLKIVAYLENCKIKNPSTIITKIVG